MIERKIKIACQEGCGFMVYLPTAMAWRDSPIIFLTRASWRYSKGNRGSVVLYYLFFVIAEVVYLFEPFVIAYVLNTIQQEGIDRNNVFSIGMVLSLMLVLEFGFWAFHGPARVMERHNAFLVRVNFKNYLLEGIMTLPMRWHTDHHSGDTIDKINKGTEALFEYSGHTFEVIESAVRLGIAYVLLSVFNVHAVYIVSLCVLFTVLLIFRYDRKLATQYRQLYRIENTISAKIFDVISNITTVIILRVERLVTNAIYKKIMAPFHLFVHNAKVNEVKWFWVSLSGAFMTFLVLFTYVYGAIAAGSTVALGTIYILYNYVSRVKDIFFRFAYQYGEIVRQKTAVLNAEEISREFKELLIKPIVDLTIPWHRISVRNLRFSYHDAKSGSMHLDGVSFEMKKGERVALIGASGSGKTTLLKIIRGLYDPQALSLKVDEEHLPDGFSALREHIALIPQDPEIFSTTIRENITIGVSHSAEYIKKFTDLACFTDVVERLPKKLNSSIVEKGVNLSGGEKQRLALARGLMACVDKSIILLDEPTSSVDIRNELAIYHNIFSTFVDATVVSSIHRLHLLPLFDTILYFKEGKIIAKGSFEELQTTSVAFKNLWEKYIVAQHRPA